MLADNRQGWWTHSTMSYISESVFCLLSWEEAAGPNVYNQWFLMKNFMMSSYASSLPSLLSQASRRKPTSKENQKTVLHISYISKCKVILREIDNIVMNIITVLTLKHWYNQMTVIYKMNISGQSMFTFVAGDWSSDMTRTALVCCCFFLPL